VKMRENEGGKMRNYGEFKEKCVKATNLWLE
jgi:hypothetical protein